MRVLLLSRYGPLGASSRVRFYQFLPHLEAAGIDVTVSPLLNDRYTAGLYAGDRRQWTDIAALYIRRITALLRARRFDLLWVEGELFPWLPAWGESLLRMAGIPYVVDYDDALFHRYDLHSAGTVRRILGQKIDSVMRTATAVAAGNEYLAARASRAGARQVEIIPTVVDTARYQQARPRDAGPFTIGWIGTPVTAPYLESVRGALKEVCADGGARIVLVGAADTSLAGLPVEVHPWSEASEVPEIQGFDVGIMPLPDGPWERGKCGYKLIQYMACARPVVASPVGVNTSIVEPGVNGFLAGNSAEWTRALQLLKNDPAQGARMGAQGRARVIDEFSVQQLAPRLVTLLRNAAGMGEE